ncbi:hypothetical protein G7046_g4342 [Stylonectria norvegica]|nr:hypothetical protein G7046_g4342 [Stylonectria norvegica]
MTSASLTTEQTRALFDILTHHETYAEIEGFKLQDAVTGYGFPFARTTVVPLGGWRSMATTPSGSVPGTPRAKTPVPPVGKAEEKDGAASDGHGDLEGDVQPSTSPLLQTLLCRFVLGLPGVRDLPPNFWAVRVQGLLARLGDAELSESYDKGALGTRKVLATGASGLIEMIGRGALGGVESRSPEGAAKKKNKKGEVDYDHSKAEDLERAWTDIVEGLVYGNLVEHMFDHLCRTDDLESHSPAVKAAAEYAIIHLATFLHHIFVFSPEGQYLLKLIENVNNLIPYKMVKQTLRVGNAATMISAMLRLLLAKLSVTSITNWVGLTANADDGMNLLQRIISLVLSWDASEFRKSADKVEKAKDRPSDEMLQAIRQYIAQGRDEHETVRAASMEHSQSIITAIFNASNPELTTALTESKHVQCLEYYSALLSVRDRENITAALCRQPPDLFTTMIKDAVGAYEPMIRTVHARVDLREHVEATQAFIEDFIRTSKPKTGTETPAGGLRAKLSSSEKGKAGTMPTVDDYVELLMRHRGVMYKWIHALAAQCPDVWEEMRVWSTEAIVKFRQERTSRETTGDADDNAGNPETKADGSKNADSSPMDDRLNALFQDIPTASQAPILAALDSHAAYLSTLTTLSHTRLQRILDTTDSDPGSMDGPGVYLSRWQGLLDGTPITPATPKGPVRRGKDVKHVMTMGKIGVASVAKAREAASESVEEEPEAPDVEVVVKEMGDGFRRLVQELGGM